MKVALKRRFERLESKFGTPDASIQIWPLFVTKLDAEPVRATYTDHTKGRTWTWLRQDGQTVDEFMKSVALELEKIGAGKSFIVHLHDSLVDQGAILGRD